MWFTEQVKILRYKNGAKNGHAFVNDSSVSLVMKYKNDKLHGNYTMYWENSKVMKLKFRSGELVGKRKYYGLKF